MWRIGTVSSRLDIHFLRLCQDLVAEVLAQLLRGSEVDAPAEDLCQFLRDVEEREARGLARLELDQNVHVAVRPEVVAQDRAEEGEPTDVMAPAEVGDSFGGDV